MKPENLGLLYRTIIATTAIVAGLTCESVHAAADQPVMFILDASSSMQNAADGRPKISQARDLIAEIVDRESGSRQFGLIAFGSRETKSCSDVQTIAPLGAKESAFKLVLRGIDAKGQAPISKALESAVTMMARSGKPGSVVLIADGNDTCSSDPCATVKELREKSPDITVHAIGFAAGSAEKVEDLACIAEAGGGRFTLVRGEEQLGEAVAAALDPDSATMTRALSFGEETEVSDRPTLSLASPLSALVAPRAAAGPGSAPKIADVLAANVGAGLFKQRAFAPSKGSSEPAAVTFSAAAADHMAPLAAGVVWRVFKAEPDPAGAHPMVDESREATPKFTLPPGDYIVHCAYGKAQTAKRIQVAGEPFAERLVLNAGALKLDAVVEDRSSPEERVIAEDQVSFAIYRGDPETTRDNVLVVPFLRPGQPIRLTEGSYHIVSHYGDANAMVRTNVRVEAGRMTQARIYHKAARITLRLLSGPTGEALANTSWKVLNPEGEVVRESVGAFPSHILAVGDYTVVAEHEQHSYKSLVSVETGRDRDVEVIAQD